MHESVAESSHISKIHHASTKEQNGVHESRHEKVLSVTGDGIIQSPEFPNTYPRNTVIVWRLVAVTESSRIQLTFDPRFGLEDAEDGICKYDYVEVEEPVGGIVLGRWCGSQMVPGPQISKGNQFLIRFVSDEYFPSDPGFCIRYTLLQQGDHTSQPPGEGLCQGTGEDNMADSGTSDSGETVRFSSRPWNTGPALYPLQGAKGFMGVCPTIHMCFVDLEKAFDCVPRGGLWRVLQEYGIRGPLLRAVRSLYDQSRSLVRIAGSKSDFFPVHVGLRQGCQMKRDIDRRIGAAAAVMPFLRRVAGLSLRDRVRSSVTREELRVEMLRWLLDAFPGSCSGQVPLGGNPGEDLGHAGGTMSPSWPGNTSVSFRQSWRKCLGKSGNLCIDCCPVIRPWISRR
ncbi:platelet-derived growth factor C [Pimephales promelas]|nr:platelet-derived growth factor C [Pimephales promelas]